MTEPSRRYLLLVNHLARAGMELQLMHLARGLAGLGHEVTIGCVEVRTDVSDLERDGVRVIELSGNGRAARMLADPEDRPDRPQLRPRPLHGVGREPVGPHGRRPRAPPDDRHRAHARPRHPGLGGRLVARQGDRAAPQAPGPVDLRDRPRRRAAADVLLAEDVPPAKLVLIPNGVPLDHIREVAASGLTRADIGLPEDAKVVMHVARFYSMKRQWWTLEAVRRLREELGDVRAVFVGMGPDLEAFREKVQRRRRRATGCTSSACATTCPPS